MTARNNLDESKFVPNHLPSTAQLQAEAEKVAEKEVPENPADNPRAKVEYTFDFEYTDATGKLWNGTFTHRVPTQAQRDQIDFIAARKKGGAPLESFSIVAVNRHFMHAHLQTCLVERPDWAENLDNLVDPTIVERLYEEVASHEAFFLGDR